MFEISSHKVSSILSMQGLKFRSFFAKSSKAVLDDTVTERADILGFGSTVGQRNGVLSASGLTACHRNLLKTCRGKYR